MMTKMKKWYESILLLTWSIGIKPKMSKARRGLVD